MTAAGTSARFASGVAIIAGGSGGIGAEIARALADAGSDVALTCNKNRNNAEAPTPSSSWCRTVPATSLARH